MGKIHLILAVLWLLLWLAFWYSNLTTDALLALILFIKLGDFSWNKKVRKISKVDYILLIQTVLTLLAFSAFKIIGLSIFNLSLMLGSIAILNLISSCLIIKKSTVIGFLFLSFPLYLFLAFLMALYLSVRTKYFLLPFPLFYSVFLIFCEEIKCYIDNSRHNQ